MTVPSTKKKAHLAGITPSLVDDTTTPRHGLMTLATAASAISPPDPWVIMPTAPSERRVQEGLRRAAWLSRL